MRAREEGTPAESSGAPAARSPGTAVALILLFGVNLLNYIDRYVLAGVLPLVEREFEGISKQQLGWLAPAFLIVYMLSSPVFGLIGDRGPRRLLIGGGVQVWSVATALAGRARSFAQLFGARMLVGIGEAAYGTTAPTVIADLYPKARRGRALAFFYVAIPVGSALGFQLGGFLGTRYSWRTAFLVVGLPGLLIGALAYLMREPRRGSAEGVESEALDRYLSRKPRVRDYLSLFRNRSYLLNTAGMTAYTYAIGGLSFWMPTFLNQERQIPLQRATFRFGLVTVVTGIVGTLGGGALADRLARRVRGAYFLVCGAGMLAAFPAFYLAIASDRPTVYWTALVLAELALFLNTGPGNTIIANVTPPRLRTGAFAINILVIHALGDVISPVVMGAIADRANLGTAFLSTSALVVLSGLFWIAGTPFLAADSDRVQAEILAAGEPCRR
jgi:MFS family permease